MILGSWESATRRNPSKDEDGIPDDVFIGDPSILKLVFRTLNDRFAKHDIIHPNTRAHYMIQKHLDDLNITARSYPLRRFLYRHNISHPNVCSSSLCSPSNLAICDAATTSGGAYPNSATGVSAAQATAVDAQAQAAPTASNAAASGGDNAIIPVSRAQPQPTLLRADVPA